MDGRDIGTVVLPNAQVKIFLTATAEDRAKRRMLEYKAKGQEADFDKILEDIIKRDYQDMNRATSPLKKAEDAILLDTTGNEFSQSVELMMNTIKSRLSI